MRDPRRAQAGARLARLRRAAAELREWGWEVKEPTEALDHIHTKMIEEKK